MKQAPPLNADVVVIGGGIIGTATAFFLARMGKKVTLFEKGRIAGEQSSRNWGSVRAQRRPEAELPLMLDSIRLWEQLEKTLEAPIDWAQQGQMRLCYDEQTLQWADSWLPIGKAHGMDTQLLTPRQTRELLPYFAANDLKGALYTSTDGCAEPEKVAPAFARAAIRHGATLIGDCAVLEINQHNQRATGVTTEHGTVSADTVVCAGGAWSNRLLKPLGHKHPSLWIRGSAAHTEPIGIDMRKLVTWGKCACRQRPDGSLLLAAAEDGTHDIVLSSALYGASFLKLAYHNRKLLSLNIGGPLVQSMKGEFNNFTHHRTLSPGADLTALRAAASAFAIEYPSAKPIRFTKTWAGQIDYMPDELPVIGESHKCSGLFVASGFSGNGFGMGPVVGKIMSQLICTGRCEHDLSAFNPGRFA